MYLFISQRRSRAFELAERTWLITGLVQSLHIITHPVCLEVLSPPASTAMTVGMEVGNLSKLPFSVCLYSFLVSPTSLCSSPALIHREHLTDVLFKDEKRSRGGIRKQTIQKYTWQDEEDGSLHARTHTHPCTHTHPRMHTHTLRIITGTVLDTSGKTASVHIHIYATIKEQCVLRKTHFHFEKTEYSCAHA